MTTFGIFTLPWGGRCAADLVFRIFDRFPHPSRVEVELVQECEERVGDIFRRRNDKSDPPSLHVDLQKALQDKTEVAEHIETCSNLVPKYKNECPFKQRHGAEWRVAKRPSRDLTRPLVSLLVSHRHRHPISMKRNCNVTVPGQARPGPEHGQ